VILELPFDGEQPLTPSPDRGYIINCILSHSLRAGGAMAMKLSGASDSTIMRVGGWTSLTLHSLTDWSPDGRRCVENVNGIHLSECRVTIRAHQKNKVFRWQCIHPCGSRPRTNFAWVHVRWHAYIITSSWSQINLAQQMIPEWQSEMLAH